MMSLDAAQSGSRMWRVLPDHPQAEAIGEAAVVVKGGGVVIYPTETLYGLGADPMCPEAVERVYRVKGRMFTKPLPLIAADATAVRTAVAQWPRGAERLAEVFWPGPLTLVLAAAPALPSLLHGRTGRIAIRVSSHPVAHALAEAVGGLLVSTSANRAGEPAHSAVGSMPVELIESVDGVLDAGVLPESLPSTIVDMSAGVPRLMREGVLPWKRVQEALGVRMSVPLG